MCLMLYLATTGDQPCFESDFLNIEDVEPGRAAIRQWLTLPVVRFVGAHTGCSCGFRSIKASEPIEYDERMFYEDERTAATERASHAALMAMARSFAERDGAIELLAVWDGDEAEPLLGTIDKTVEELQPQTWFFIERFVYRVTNPAT